MIYYKKGTRLYTILITLYTVLYHPYHPLPPPPTPPTPPLTCKYVYKHKLFVRNNNFCKFCKMDFISSINSFIKTKRFADSVDYFNNQFIPGFILSCSFIMTFKQYVIKPISCYIPNHPLGRGFDQYIQNQCYLSEEYAIHNVNQEIHWKSISPAMLRSYKYM